MRGRRIVSLLVLLLAGTTLPAAPKPWPQNKANAWYRQQPWLVGSNYIPSNAINQLEMWQAATFDPQRIDTELGWAESLGMNTMRVFLHDLLWEQDQAGFRQRLDTFLTIANKHHIRPLLVLFDSCWDPNPQLGPQRAPKPGVHNSGWMQSPGAGALDNPAQYPRLKAWVKGVVGAFAKDRRILGWDVWNEPDNTNDGSYTDPPDKVQRVLVLLPQAFAWARSVHPVQPLTSGIWKGDGSPTEKIQLENSDVISFHSYDPPDEFESRVKSLTHYGRPILCTEYMARPRGSTFASILPVAKKYDVGAMNWGFVQGKTQTYLPWDSWQHPYVDHPPEVWFHDIFYPDGKPYRQEEVEFIRAITEKSRHHGVPAPEAHAKPAGSR
jgi:Cellulase (glycosyl hydrolase family 5)